LDHFGDYYFVWGAVFEKASNLSAAIVVGASRVDVF
jgi:hypothetical protein